MNGYYRDPILLAVARAAEAQDHVSGSIEYRPNGPWFSGSAWTPRWMWLHASEVRIRCIDNGFEIQPPSRAAALDSFKEILSGHGGTEQEDGDYFLPVPQQEADGERVDTSDRVQLCGSLLRDLLSAGM